MLVENQHVEERLFRSLLVVCFLRPDQDPFLDEEVYRSFRPIHDHEQEVLYLFEVLLL